MTIQVKNYKVLRGLMSVPFHPTLIALTMWITIRHSQTVFTSAYREGDKGVHGQNPCRGLDIRSKVFHDPRKIVNDINTHWLYDPGREQFRCAKLHDAGKGKHIHLQVHDKTRYLGGFCNKENKKDEK